MSKYCISDHCRWVKGACGSAIFDLKNEQVYSINQKGTQALAAVLSGDDPEASSVEYLKALEARGLLNDHSTPVTELHILPGIQYVWLELTGNCNCRCLHCYGTFGLPSSGKIRSELTLDEWKNVVDTIVKAGCKAVQLIGGEPLLHPQFNIILKYVSDSGIEKIDIFTNAYSLTEETADLISEVKASVRISLYGYNAETHDAITQHPGSFAKLDKSIDMLTARNVPIDIAVVIMRENQDILPQIKDYIRAKGLSFNGFDTVRPVKHSIQESHSVTREDVNAVRIMHTPKFRTSVYSFSRNRQWNSCWYGKFAITAHGDVIPCIFARDLPCGNIRNDDFTVIRERLLNYWRITKDDVEVCKDCEYRYVCDDCRPLAMGDNGSIYGKYPRCTYDPYSCTWRKL